MRARPEAPPNRLPGRLVACLFLAWAAARALSVWLLGWGVGSDVARYRLIARLWSAGAAPYAGFQLEYPPLALPFLLAPLLVAGEPGYARAFGLEMVGFDLMGLWLVMAWASRLHAGRMKPVVVAGVTYLAVTAGLFPVLYARFDLVPATLTLAALYLAYGPAPGVAALLVGFAGAVKLWPLALAPLFCGLEQRRRGWPGAARTASLVAVGFLVPLAAALARSGTRVGEFLVFHYRRGIQLESTWASLALVLADLGVAPVEVDTRFGAIHLQGPLASPLAHASTPALLALALAPQLVVLRRGLGGPLDRHGERGLLAAGAAVLGFLIGGKVLSPQFLLWVAPILALLAGDALGRILALAAAALTTAIYPYLWPALLHQAPGHLAALAALVARNALLVAFYRSLLGQLARSQAYSASPD